MTPVPLPKLTFKYWHDPILEDSIMMVFLGDPNPLICKHLYSDDTQVYNTRLDMLQAQKSVSSPIPLVDTIVYKSLQTLKTQKLTVLLLL